jgi:Pilus formation protein N terminal region
MMRLSFSALAAALVLVSSTSQAQEIPKPNLSETNIREAPKSPTQQAGSPGDYVLFPAGRDSYLRFDLPVAEIKVDNPDVLSAMPNPNDPTTVVLRPQQAGRTRVIVYGALEGVAAAVLQTARVGDELELAPKQKLLYDAQVVIGSHVVIIHAKGVREIMDCAPGCYPSPIHRPREPDQIIENRNR